MIGTERKTFSGRDVQWHGFSHSVKDRNGNPVKVLQEPHYPSLPRRLGHFYYRELGRSRVPVTTIWEAERVAERAARSLVIPTPTLKWFCHEYEDPRPSAMSLRWKTWEDEVDITGCVFPLDHNTVFIRSDVEGANLVAAVTHEAYHVSQFRTQGTLGADRKQWESDAEAYAAACVATWEANGKNLWK